MKNILHRLIEGHTHFGMPRGAKTNFALNEPKKVALPSNSNTTFNIHYKWKEINHSRCRKTNRKS